MIKQFKCNKRLDISVHMCVTMSIPGLFFKKLGKLSLRPTERLLFALHLEAFQALNTPNGSVTIGRINPTDKERTSSVGVRQCSFYVLFLSGSIFGDVC